MLARANDLVQARRRPRTIYLGLDSMAQRRELFMLPSARIVLHRHRRKFGGRARLRVATRVSLASDDDIGAIVTSLGLLACAAARDHASSG